MYIMKNSCYDNNTHKIIQLHSEIKFTTNVVRPDIIFLAYSMT